jgi:hypothetical protein
LKGSVTSADPKIMCIYYLFVLLFWNVSLCSRRVTPNYGTPERITWRRATSNEQPRGAPGRGRARRSNDAAGATLWARTRPEQFSDNR